ncbi:MAG: DUF1731 domain-containing protein, partial [Actinobacteria bacterium]|nr:DUF1731 domain-containing protein [Actinomycetota bacterium]
MARSSRVARRPQSWLEQVCGLSVRRTGPTCHPSSGLGGPLAGGRQYLPWIHHEDLIGMYLCAIDPAGFSGAINGSAPSPVTNREFSKALGRVLHRPAIVPIPGIAAKIIAGDIATYAVTGVRMVPGRADELGYTFAYSDIDSALSATLRTWFVATIRG